MSTINLPKVRACSDITFRVSLKDNDVAIDWTSLSDANAFTNFPTTCEIIVPSGKLTAYQTANIWSTYASQMVEA